MEQWNDVAAEYIALNFGVSCRDVALSGGLMTDIVGVFDAIARFAEEAALRKSAEMCAAQQQVFLSEEYATGQPMSSFGERFACGKCRDEILALLPAPPLSDV